MEEIAGLLYPLVAIISIVGYAPQIKTLLFATRRPQNLSLSSWVIWLVSGVISLLYGVYQLQDSVFIFTAAVNLFLLTFTTGLIVYNRYIRFEDVPLFFMPAVKPIVVENRQKPAGKKLP